MVGDPLTYAVIGAGSLDGYATNTAAFRQGLKETGFVPGQDVAKEG